MKHFVVIIGPDGCGKTTIAETLRDKATVLGYNSAILRACNFEIIPSIGQIIAYFTGSPPRDRKEGFQGLHSGHQQCPNHPIKSLIFILWYSLDYFLGRTLVRRVKQENTLLCFARYYYDFYFQISNSRLPHFLIRIFEKLVPDPEVIIYLHRSPETIYKDKPELQIEEIRRQQEAIQKIGRRLKQFILIDANDGVNATLEQVLKVLQE